MMKRNTFSLKNEGKEVGYVGTVFEGVDDTPTGVRFSFKNVWGKFDVVEKTFKYAISDFVGSLESMKYCADIKCTLSSCPGDSYYIRITGENVMIQDSERTILAGFKFDEITNVSDTVAL